MNRSENVPPIEHAKMIGEQLATFLNEEGEANRAVLAIFHVCNELDMLRRNQPVMEGTSPDWWNYHLIKTKLLKDVNRSLSEFQFRVVLDLGPIDARDRFSSQWLPVTETTTKSPAHFIRILIEMTERGTLDRIRKCVCGRWFFASSNKKLVCSDSCRVRKHKQEQTEEFKAQRRKYMNNYNRLKAVKSDKRKRMNARKTNTPRGGK